MPVHNRNPVREEREYSSCITRDGVALQVGDLVTAYRQGVHVITRITQTFQVHDGVCVDGDHYNIYYKQVCHANGVLSKHAKVEHECGSFYCMPAQNYIDNLRKQADALEASLNEYKYCMPAQNYIDSLRKQADALEATLNEYKQNRT